MRTFMCGLLGGVLGLAVLIGGLPLFLPFPRLRGTVPPEQLADADSQFMEVNGIRVHYKQMGQGEPVIVLLHGFAASVYSWREVMEPLSHVGTVIAFDRPSSGLTERPMAGEWTGASPYSVSGQADLTMAILDRLGVEKAVLVGHSAGGTVATVAALRYPQRVEKLVLVDPAVYQSRELPRWVGPVLASRQMRWYGPLFMRSITRWGEEMLVTAWHDPSAITEKVRAEYRKPLQAENWDRALWELVVARESLDLGGQVAKLDLPTLVITGDDDRIVPAESSVRLAGALPQAELVVIRDCGHLPQEERPQEFLDAVLPFLKTK